VTPAAILATIHSLPWPEPVSVDLAIAIETSAPPAPAQDAESDPVTEAEVAFALMRWWGAASRLQQVHQGGDDSSPESDEAGSTENGSSEPPIFTPATPSPPARDRASSDSNALTTQPGTED